MSDDKEEEFKSTVALDNAYLFTFEKTFQDVEAALFSGDLGKVGVLLDFARARLPMKVRKDMPELPSKAIEEAIREVSGKGAAMDWWDGPKYFDDESGRRVTRIALSYIERINDALEGAGMLMRGRRRQVSKKDFPQLGDPNVTTTQGGIDDASQRPT